MDPPTYIVLVNALATINLKESEDSILHISDKWDNQKYLAASYDYHTLSPDV